MPALQEVQPRQSLAVMNWPMATRRMHYACHVNVTYAPPQAALAEPQGQAASCCPAATNLVAQQDVSTPDVHSDVGQYMASSEQDTFSCVGLPPPPSLTQHLAASNIPLETAAAVLSSVLALTVAYVATCVTWHALATAAAVLTCTLRTACWLMGLPTPSGLAPGHRDVSASHTKVVRLPTVGCDTRCRQTA